MKNCLQTCEVFECGQVLAGLGELALLHALADVPVDEGALGVHEVCARGRAAESERARAGGGAVRERAIVRERRCAR